MATQSKKPAQSPARMASAGTGRDGDSLDQELGELMKDLAAQTFEMRRDEPDVQDVPIVDSREVEMLRAKLAEVEARADRVEGEMRKALGVRRGMPSPEMADPYVEADEQHAGLNETNAEDTMSLAEQKNRPEFKSSHITHRLGNNKTKGRGTTFWLYDKQGMARRVPGQSLSAAQAFGLLPVCPKCSDYHKESATNPNACSARPKVARTTCQICKSLYGRSVYIYDTTESYSAEQPEDDDDTMQVMELPSSPAERLKIKLEEHIRWWHTATASSMKLV